MRFWQKTYILTLAVFLICLNAGILSLTYYTYSKSVASAEATASAEQYYIARAFERDLEDIGEHQSRELLMQSYGTYYSEKGISLSFSTDGKVVYSNISEDIEIKDDVLLHTELDGVRHIVICSSAGGYRMIFAKNVESLNEEFNSLTFTYVMTALGVSLLLATVLYILLRRLSLPLDRLRETTERIRGGDLSVSADESGNDEFSMLGASFNSMLATINSQMAALEADAEKKQMLVDNMAHELRTPLTSIRGYAEYLERAAVSEEQRLLAAKYIVSEAERLAKISEILLDGAYIRGNPPEMKEVELSAILRDTAERLDSRGAEKGVEIVCDCEERIVSGNATLLSMLFYNLTENAIKACGEGGRVILRCSESSVSVEDSGKGMTEEQLSHITEPFYRTDKSRSRAEGGAGLGLALCKNIADIHGARLRFESKIGEGTIVFLDFTT